MASALPLVKRPFKPQHVHEETYNLFPQIKELLENNLDGTLCLWVLEFLKDQTQTKHPHLTIIMSSEMTEKKDYIFHMGNGIITNVVINVNLSNNQHIQELLTQIDPFAESYGKKPLYLYELGSRPVTEKFISGFYQFSDKKVIFAATRECSITFIQGETVLSKQFFQVVKN